MKYDYGKPEQGYTFEHYNFYDTLLKMDGGRHQVIYFPFDEIMIKVGRDKMNEYLLEIVKKEKPDFCFFCLFTDEIKKETIKKISQSGKTITFNWFCDDDWRFDNFSKFWAPCFNWISTTASTALPEYQKIGYQNVIKTQWACNHFLYKPNYGSRTSIDISFVGQAHGRRRKIIEKIEKAGINIECFGSGWPKGRISQEEMIKIFSQSKISLNLTESSSGFHWKPLLKIFLNRRSDNSLHFRNPNYWLANIKSLLAKRLEIKGRNFEIPGCGGFLLTRPADNLKDYYLFNKEIGIFNDFDELIEKIKYYLAHNKERKAIAQAGYQRTIGEHTYEQRFREIFETVGALD